jgi:hypothetical protein
VADRNVERFQRTERIDLDYLAGLSADAVPALAALPEGIRQCVLQSQTDLLFEPDGWPGWNLGRERARLTLERLFPAPCAT